MKYLSLILLFFIAGFLFILVNFYNNGWQFLQPFLVAVLLVYFNDENPWDYYTFAVVSGLFVDAFTGVFGLHAILFIIIILILRSMQLTILTSRNILSILILTILSFVLFWLLFWGLNFIFDWQLYSFSWSIILSISKVAWVNILAVILFHLLLFNLWGKKHEQRQSF